MDRDQIIACLHALMAVLMEGRVLRAMEDLSHLLTTIDEQSPDYTYAEPPEDDLFDVTPQH